MKHYKINIEKTTEHYIPVEWLNDIVKASDDKVEAVTAIQETWPELKSGWGGSHIWISDSTNERLVMIELHDNSPAPKKPGYTFSKWSEVKDMVKEARRSEERRIARPWLCQFHYHGLVLCVNDERTGDPNDKVSLRELKSMVASAEANYPGKEISISLEGHWDFWESFADKFAGEMGEPTMFYINVPLYKNF